MNEKALSCANFVDSRRERKIVDGCMMRYLIPWFFEGSGTSSSGSGSSSCVVTMQVLLLLNFSFVLSSSSAPVLALRHVQFLDHFSFQEADRIAAAEELHAFTRFSFSPCNLCLIPVTCHSGESSSFSLHL
jgi:hypothetical protein